MWSQTEPLLSRLQSLIIFTVFYFRAVFFSVCGCGTRHYASSPGSCLLVWAGKAILNQGVVVLSHIGAVFCVHVHVMRSKTWQHREVTSTLTAHTVHSTACYESSSTQAETQQQKKGSK